MCHRFLFRARKEKCSAAHGPGAFRCANLIDGLLTQVINADAALTRYLVADEPDFGEGRDVISRSVAVARGLIRHDYPDLLANQTIHGIAHRRAVGRTR